MYLSPNLEVLESWTSWTTILYTTTCHYSGNVSLTLSPSCRVPGGLSWLHLRPRTVTWRIKNIFEFSRLLLHRVKYIVLNSSFHFWSTIPFIKCVSKNTLSKARWTFAKELPSINTKVADLKTKIFERPLRKRNLPKDFCSKIFCSIKQKKMLKKTNGKEKFAQILEFHCQRSPKFQFKF